MTFLLKYEFWSLTAGLNVLKIFGFLVPGTHSRYMKRFLWVYWFFWFMNLNAIYVIIQFGDLLQIWGDISLMVSSSFLLFTSIALSVKIGAFRMRRPAVLAIIDEGEEELRDEEMAEGRNIINEYPYNEYKSPAYEITYMQQAIVLPIMAAVNISMDGVIAGLIAVCRCRLKLVGLALRNLCRGLVLEDTLTAEQEEIVSGRLRACVRRHQAVLRSAAEIQACFGEAILAQITVSMIIICVSAYELSVSLHSDSKNIIHIVAMSSYLIGMVLQVFMYCYQGDQLANESSEISFAAYECEWYCCSLRLRRSLLVVMARSRRVAQLSAGGFTDLSLTCFTSIMKASYSFFTVLQQVEN